MPTECTHSSKHSPFVLLLVVPFRTVGVATSSEVPALLLVVIASIGLAGGLRKVQDIEGLSRDARYLGAYLIALFGERRIAVALEQLHLVDVVWPDTLAADLLKGSFLFGRTGHDLPLNKSADYRIGMRV